MRRVSMYPKCVRSTSVCKHKFEPRYDEEYSTGLNDVVESQHRSTELDVGGAVCTSYLKKRTYIHDICVKCGDIIKRE